MTNIKHNDTMTIHIEKVTEADFPRLQWIWESSVLATHDFLKEDDFKEIQQLLIPAYFPQVTLYKAVSTNGEILGFLGTQANRIEMLFIDDQFRGQGAGSALLKFALQSLKIDELDVNEQNKSALAFYQHHGFQITARSDVDGSGKPYPTLTLKLSQ